MTGRTDQPGDVTRVGVIGLGWAGQQHLEAFSQAAGVEVLALAGMEDDLRQTLGGQYGVPHLVRTWEELLEVDSLDAVSIAVPTFLHAPIAIAALERGLHVLCEKPLARDADEGQIMVDAARRAGRVLDVAFNHRRRGDIRALKGVIDSGELGRSYYAKASWLRRQGIPQLGSWFTSKELSGGGPLIDIGVHVLDYALYLLDEPKAVTVSASAFAELGTRGRGGAKNVSVTREDADRAYEVEDFSSAFVRFDDGSTLILEAGWATYREAEDLLDFSVYGTEGGAHLHVAGAAKTPVGELRVFTDEDGETADYALTAEPGRGHGQVIQDFIEVIRGDRVMWRDHDGSLALERARIIDACYRSAAARQEVRLADA
ncbi:Gfo/Idh/MocA family protein [Nesterenkonia sp. HG001]|uniref:Gfo/Idh/MocA family protein n=1 Tax=Nesterenkonia sp. HG001 TaxID=2983207 RepID=UPI003A0FBFE8